VLETLFFREVGVFVGDDVLFQWRGTCRWGWRHRETVEGSKVTQPERTRASVVMNINESHHSRVLETEE
jgi:hypothetical protein